MNHSVIIPEVVKIQKGDNVKWINVGKDFHNSIIE